MSSWVQRFWAKTEKTSGGCIVWTGCRNAKGYGRFGLNGKARFSHRVAWEMVNGPIPAGYLICHRCDNPPCVNPDHLFLGAVADNNWDSVLKGRRKHLVGRYRPQMKLNAELVRQIRASSESHAAVARRLGVAARTVSYVRHGDTWAWVI